MRAVSLLLVLALCPVATAQKPEAKYAGKPLAYWVEKFQKAETDTDLVAAEQAVCAFGPDAAPAVPALVEMLDDRSQTYREQVANMLCAIGPAAKGAVPDLIKLLEAKSPRDPHQVIRVLCAIGPDAKDAIPAIRRVVRTYLTSKEEPGLELWWFGSATGHYDFHRLGPDVVPMLLDAIEARDTWPGGLSEVAILNCFESLRELGPAAKAAAPRLVKLLKHKAPEFRFQVATTLWAVERNPAAIAVLVDLLKGDNRKVAVSAVVELGDIGLAAKDALPALKALLPKESLPPYLVAPAGNPDDDIRVLQGVASDAVRKIEQKPKK
jgi:HEAT repeat protein